EFAMPNVFAEGLLDQAGKALEARQFAQADTLVTQALAFEPENLRGWCFRAITAAEVGRKELALKTIQRALKRAPQLPAVMNNAATVFSQCGQPARAEQLWRAILKITPQSVDAHWNLAMYYVRQEEMDDAEPHLRKVMELAPSHPRAYMSLGNLLKSAGR